MVVKHIYIELSALYNKKNNPFMCKLAVWKFQMIG